MTEVPSKARAKPNPKTIHGAAKPSINNVPPLAIFYMGLAMEEGTRKYGSFNWREAPVSFSVYYNATMRHLMAYMDGEHADPKTHVPHLAYALANLAIIVDAIHSDTMLDDRPVMGTLPKFILDHTETIATFEPEEEGKNDGRL